VQLKRSKRKDLYSVLGVGQDASESEIKTAYRKAALRLHPGTSTAASVVGPLCAFYLAACRLTQCDMF
jgi:curved DNA-binding protein CbpA